MGDQQGNSAEQMKELGSFLRSRRDALVRAELDLPPILRSGRGGKSRTTGLRREEVAIRAGVSVTWYTWLEQGRNINPSRQVLDALAVTMRFSQAEHEYVLALAGYAAAPVSAPSAPEALPDHLQRFVDAQNPSPAFVLADDWTILGWNAAYQHLFQPISDMEASHRNLLLLIFMDPYVRQLLPDWEVTSRQFLAEYRAETGGKLGQGEHVALISRLRQESPEFAQAWQAHQIERFTTRQRAFNHPEDGTVVYEQHRMVPTDRPDLQLIVYLHED